MLPFRLSGILQFCIKKKTTQKTQICIKFRKKAIKTLEEKFVSFLKKIHMQPPQPINPTLPNSNV